MGEAGPFLVVLAAFLGTSFLGLFGWLLTNSVRFGRIVERMQAKEESRDEADRLRADLDERRHAEHGRRLDRLEERSD